MGELAAWKVEAGVADVSVAPAVNNDVVTADRRRVLRQGLTAFDRHRPTNVIDQLAKKE